MDDDFGNGIVKYQNGLGIDDKLKLTSGGVSKYFLADHLGSTTALTDSSGNAISSANYDSFGNSTNNLTTRYQFTGREKDEFTGLYFYRNRWYDGKLGRFISEDPIGFAGGDINLYGYVRNNPAMFRDPSGHIPVMLPPIGVRLPQTPGQVLDEVQLLLGAAGLIPGFGEPADAVDGAISLARGNYLDASLSGASMIPFLGTGAGITKICKRGNKIANKIPWTSWDNYPKVISNGEDYAQVGNRLYSRHAVDRMQPSGLRYRTGGQDGGMPQIRQTGGNYDYGRGVAPQFVEDAISSSKGVLRENGNFSHISGTLQVILSPQGHIVTIITH